MIRTIFTQESKAEACAPWDKVADARRAKHDRRGAWMDAAREAVLTDRDDPQERWARGSPRRIPSNGGARRSSGAPTSSASSRTTRRSFARSAP
jgi:hypothetical protein